MFITFASTITFLIGGALLASDALRPAGLLLLLFAAALLAADGRLT